MDVADLETCAVTGQTARTQRGETSLVRQFGQRIILIHELGQLGGSEEFLDSSRHRLDVDQGLRAHRLGVLRRHSLADHSLKTGETDTVLVLEQLADRTDPAVTQMIDVILIADPVLEMHVIVDGGKNILPGNMLRNKFMHSSSERKA